LNNESEECCHVASQSKGHLSQEYS
jgi:hypothetical protein